MTVLKECCLQRVEAFALVVQERTGASGAGSEQNSEQRQQRASLGSTLGSRLGMETNGTSWRFGPTQPQTQNLQPKTFIQSLIPYNLQL